MERIIMGTTPTFEYTFKTVDVSNITTAILTIKQGGEVAIEKTLSDATATETALCWTLTQVETLSLEKGAASVMLNWKTSDGTRGASAEEQLSILTNFVKEVI